MDSFLSAAFTLATLSSDNLKGLATAMEVYLADVNQQKPAMVSRYEQIIPEVKRALSAKPASFGEAGAAGLQLEPQTGSLRLTSQRLYIKPQTSTIKHSILCR